MVEVRIVNRAQSAIGYMGPGCVFALLGISGLLFGEIALARLFGIACIAFGTALAVSGMRIGVFVNGQSLRVVQGMFRTKVISFDQLHSVEVVESQELIPWKDLTLVLKDGSQIKCPITRSLRSGGGSKIELQRQYLENAIARHRRAHTTDPV